MHRLSRWTVGVVLLTVLGGCQTSKQTQLEAVAKDWSSVIRASQVIPVYPLTEDLQPGDVFLVQVPIDHQQAVYRQRGFLPLDNHIARLNPDGYEAFYGHSFLVGGAGKPLPVSYLNPGGDKTQAWIASPQAGFPTYSFSVKRGAGFNGALPVHGVPVGLSLLGTDTADGSITIDKARTYGVDIASLYAQVLLWANQPQVQSMLANYAPHDQEQNYVRVVSRVYLVGRLLVTLTDTSSRSGGVDVGAAKPAAVLTASSATAPSAATAENYKAGIETLNQMLADVLTKTETANGQNLLMPGASLRVVAASARSITTAEDFIDRPLVIGYLGFDFPIMDQGALGPPIPTHARLENEPVNAPRRVFSANQAATIAARAQVAKRPTAREDFRNVFAMIGPEWVQRYDQHLATGTPLGAYNSTAAEYLESESGDSGPRHEILALALGRVANAAPAQQPQTQPGAAPVPMPPAGTSPTPQPASPPQ